MPLQVYTATITNVTALTSTVRGIDLRLDAGKTLPFKTGQWINLHLNHQGTIIKRAFSIASPETTNDAIQLCIKKIENGIGSSILFAMQNGDALSFSGPFGHFTLKPTKNDIVLIATGSGVAPLRAMVQDLIHKNVTNKITLLFGNRTEDEIIYRTELEALAREHAHFTFYPILSKPEQTWNGETGHVQDLIKKYIQPDNKNQDFYICGLKAMVFSVKELLEQLGFPKEHIYFERYD